MADLCGEYQYQNITQIKINKILEQLKLNGATITGNNPWLVDVNSNGVKLSGSWNPSTATLAVVVTDKSWYVSCSKIWDKIDPLINHIASLHDSEIG
jgi:hypothetical protein